MQVENLLPTLCLDYQRNTGDDIEGVRHRFTEATRLDHMDEVQPNEHFTTKRQAGRDQ